MVRTDTELQKPAGLVDKTTASGDGESTFEAGGGVSFVSRHDERRTSRPPLVSRFACLRQTNAKTRDRTGDLQIFSLTLSQLSYRGFEITERNVC